MNKDKIHSLFSQLLVALKLDINDDNLCETPKRLTKMFTTELFKGLYEPFPEIKRFPNKGKGFFYQEVPFVSVCAHHFQPVKGVVHVFVDYSDSEYVIGLSKFNRIIDHLARRPTLQEDLTESIRSNLVEILNTDTVGIIVKGTHHCVTDRGVCAAYSKTITSTFGDNESFENKCLKYFSKG